MGQENRQKQILDIFAQREVDIETKRLKEQVEKSRARKKEQEDFLNRPLFKKKKKTTKSKGPPLKISVRQGVAGLRGLL